MKKQIIIIISILLYFSLSTIAQDVHIYGRVFSTEKEPVVGAYIYEEYSKKSTLSDKYGYFNILVKPGSVKLVIQHLAYKSTTIELNTAKDTSLNIYLSSALFNINEVTVSASRNSFTRSYNLSLINIPAKQFDLLPAIMGEKDIFKGILTLPGVQPGLDGSSQLNIRGANPEQNLILVDGMPITHPTHIFGFLSIINNQAIKDAKLYKGAIPAYFTNLSSGVLDLTLKDGSLTKRKIILEQNIFDSKISLDGYIIKNKLSATFFYRKTFIDPIIKLSHRLLDTYQNIQLYGFSDLSTKFRLNINKNNTLSFSYFQSHDGYTYTSLDSFYNPTYRKEILSKYSDNLSFGNKTLSIRLFSILSKKLTLENIIGQSLYEYIKSKDFSYTLKENADSLLNEQSILQKNSISQYILRTKLNYFATSHLSLNSGYNITFQKLYLNFYNSSYYFLDKLRINSTSLLDTSLLASPYFYLNYETSTIYLKLGGVYNIFSGRNYTYKYFSPRISTILFPQHSITMQLSFSRLYQMNHLLATSAISNPADYIIPTTHNLKPIYGNIYDLTLNIYKLKNIEISISGYYKTFDNLTRFKLGTNLVNIKDNIYDYISTGRGYSYGLEVLINKTSGRLTGWLSYTYSRSFRQFQDINLGQTFPYKYDRPHILNLVLMYRLSRSIQLTLNWSYYSGHFVTVPGSIYIAGFPQYTLNQAINFYSNINNVRTPAYHRLDIALNYHRPGRHSYWSIGVYNLYNRLNPVYLEPTSDGRLRGIALFPIMPFISYRLELVTR